MKNTKLLLILVIASSMLVACSSNITSDTSDSSKNNPKVETKSTSETEEGNSDSSSKKDSVVDIMNRVAENSKSTDEIYVTGDVTVGEKGDVKAGIYDLEITGGSGNITGDRKKVDLLFINWVAGAPGSSSDFPSKIRLILFDGDILHFSNISKIKFNAVPTKVQTSNELGIGEYIVGRDIKPGTYKLSTNMNMDPQFDNLGWEVRIYNDLTRSTKEQRLAPGNLDVAVKLDRKSTRLNSSH